MANISLTINGLQQLDRLLAVTNPKLYEKAIKGGISYAGKAVKPAVAKGIGSSYYLKAQRIKQDISSVRVAPDGSQATIRFSRRPPTLTQYGARPGRRGRQPGLGRGLGWGPAQPPGRPLTATIIKAKGRQPIGGAFLVTGNNGNLIAVRRVGDRLKAVYGPSIGSIFLGRSEISQQLQSDVQARINEQFIKGFQRVLDSASRGYR